VDIQTFLRQVLRQTPFLALVSLIAALIVVGYTWTQPDKYVSAAVLHTGIITGEAVELGDDSRLDRLSVTAQVKNMTEMLESRRVITEAGLRVLHGRLMQGDVPRFMRSAPVGSPLHDADRVLAIVESYLDSAQTFTVPDPAADSVLMAFEEGAYGYKALSRHLTVEELGGPSATGPAGDLLRVSFESSDPREAAAIVRTVTEVFRTAYGSWQAEEARASREFFERQTEQSRVLMQELEDQLEQFKIDNRIVNLGEQTSALLGQQERLQELMQQQSQIIEARRAAVARTDALLADAGVRADQMEQWRVSSEVVSSENRLQDLQRALTRAQLAGAREAPLLLDSVQAMRRKLDTRLGELVVGTQANLNQSQADLLRRRYDLLIELDIARATRQAAMDELQAVSPRMADVARGGARLARLERELRLAEQQYTSMLAKLSLARSYESRAASTNIRVIEPARVPLEPEPSKRGLLVALAAVGTFLAGVVVLLGLEYFDTTLKTPRRIERTLGVPLVTAYPLLQPKSGKARGRKGWHAELARVRFVAAARGLRQAIVDAKGSTYLFASLTRHAGTSTAVRWTVDSLVQAHRTVAVVVFCRAADDPAYAGLPHVEAPMPEPGHRLQPEAVHADPAGVTVMHVGDAGATALECSTEADIRALLHALAHQANIVLIDAPALLGNTTALEIAPLVDHVIIVQPADRSLSPAQERLLRRLRKQAPAVLGVVSTMVREEHLEEIFGAAKRPQS